MDMSNLPWHLIALGFAAFFAGAQNALAGGGSFVTLPALMLTGLDARAANITSTVALFPGQITGGLAGRGLVQGVGTLPFSALMMISLGGGVVGALLLLATPADFFAAMVPYLVLFATSVFAWGSFLRKPGAVAKPLPPRPAALIQFGIAIYGGYFGGGIGFLMLAILTMAGVAMRNAGAMKNILAGAMNASAVLVFMFSPEVAWLQAAIVAVTAMAGGLVGAWLLKRVNEKLLRGFVVLVGIALTIGLFLRGA
jgi:uncharacterized membrane protein YfcA